MPSITDPAYSLTIPSVEDDLTLDCRIYHPKHLTEFDPNASHRLKGAVIAHPYAPLGGSYDDPVVLAVAETLLDQGYVVATFNFRGAGQSAGKTSWTGRAETEDYISVAGFLIYYLHFLPASITANDEMDPASSTNSRYTLEMILAGYSYGSLILAKLSPPPTIIQRFHEATVGTAPAEVVMRAHTLAEQTQRTLNELLAAHVNPRGRSLNPGDVHNLSPSKQRVRQPGPVTVGGEETNPTQRRSSRDSRRSVDGIVRMSADVPRRIRAHIRKNSSQASAVSTTSNQDRTATPSKQVTKAVPSVVARYLLVSPVIFPFTTTICPPGSPALMRGVQQKDAAAAKAGALFLRHPTLAVFGSSDSFTSSRTLRAWAERQTKESETSGFEWHQVNSAGHFWHDQKAMLALQKRIITWLKESSPD